MDDWMSFFFSEVLQILKLLPDLLPVGLEIINQGKYLFV